MLRVSHVVYSMAAAGYENLLMNIYRNIDRSQIQFDFVVHTEEKAFFDDEVKALGGKIYRTKFKHPHYFSYYRFWNQFLQEHPECRIVHGHYIYSAPIYLLSAKNHGRIAVIHTHTPGNPQKNFRFFMRNIRNYFTRYTADYFFGCSKQAGMNTFGAQIVKSNRYQFLSNGIFPDQYQYNPETRKSVRQEYGISEETTIIGHVGRLTLAKNHPFLINFFEAFHTQRPDSQLWLIGGGEDEEMLRALVAQKNLNDSVVFIGVTGEVKKFLQAMDLFVFPSLWEGLPLALVEAQAAGLPCLVSEAIQEEADIKAGLLCKMSLRDSYEKWVAAALEQLKNTTRKNTSQYVAQAGFDIKTTANWLSDLYLRWANQNGA